VQLSCRAHQVRFVVGFSYSVAVPCHIIFHHTHQWYTPHVYPCPHAPQVFFEPYR
jgi:hypothetical protein